MPYTDFIIRSLQGASRIALDGFGKVSGVTKIGDNNQVLTETDIQIGQYFISEIKKTYPLHNIIDEEAGVIDNGSEFTWVIDPIDGTSNFAQGTPLYGIMIGLLEKNFPLAGGISLPAFNEVYSAEKGCGAFCNGAKITVTTETRLLSALVAYGIDGHQENPQITHEECRLLSEIVLGIRNLRMSNSVFDVAMLAKGKYGGLLNKTSKIWDNVAQHILIEEAGGVYTDFYGKPLDYSNPTSKADLNFSQCAASPILHEKLQEIIHNSL